MFGAALPIDHACPTIKTIGRTWAMTVTTLTKNTMHGLFVGLTGDASRARAMRILLQAKRATAAEARAQAQGQTTATRRSSRTH